jgi:anthranilate/para-aminobenzoate synthase component II
VKDKYINALYNKPSKGLNELAEFEGGEYGGINVPEHEIASRTLTVIIPGPGTPEQAQILRQIVQVGKQRGVNVRIEVYR